MTADWEDDYRMCANGCGWWQEPTRGTFDMTGQDRIRMLQGFCTADIDKLEPGSGTEAFILNPKGKVLAWVRVYKLDDRLWIDCDLEDVSAVIQHLDRYVIREDVQFEDRTASRCTFVVAGPQSEGILTRLLLHDLPDGELAVDQFSFQDQPVRATYLNEYEVVAYRLDIPAEFATTFAGLLDEELPRLDSRLAETLRIEFGTPKAGVDVTEDNLPQELQRDAQAISFTKGCYLGQETVARIDALGHVNQLLVGVKFPKDTEVQPGIELARDGKSVGKVTSVAFSTRVNGPIALAYVRRGHHDPQTVLSSPAGDARIVSFPIYDDDDDLFDGE